MCKQFAEVILDSMVNENGECEPRSLSYKQFNILSSSLYEFKDPYMRDGIDRFTYKGNIGRYCVELHAASGTYNPYSVKSVCKRSSKDACVADESEYVGNVKDRLRLNLVCVAVNATAYGRCYTFADKEGNAFVWFTSTCCFVDEDAEATRFATVGSEVCLRGTVKAHKEYKGIKQTVLTRCRVSSVNGEYVAA